MIGVPTGNAVAPQCIRVWEEGRVVDLPFPSSERKVGKVASSSLIWARQIFLHSKKRRAAHLSDCQKCVMSCSPSCEWWWNSKD